VRVISAVFTQNASPTCNVQRKAMTRYAFSNAMGKREKEGDVDLGVAVNDSKSLPRRDLKTLG